MAASLQEHQCLDAFCKDIESKLAVNDPALHSYKMTNGALTYAVGRNKTRRYIVPLALRPML